MARSRKKIVHVNQHRIRSNRKHKTNDPVITIKLGGRNVYAHECEILGPSRLVYRPDKPLSCGARLWLETTAEVVVDGRDVETIPAEKSC